MWSRLWEVWEIKYVSDDTMLYLAGKELGIM